MGTSRPDMSIEVTERAAEHIRRSVAGREGSQGLRLGVRTSGCSGFMYTVDYADEVSDDDSVFETQGVLDAKGFTTGLHRQPQGVEGVPGAAATRRLEREADDTSR